MNYKMMGRIIAPLLGIEALFMIPAMFISMHYHEIIAAKSILYTILIIAIVASILYYACKDAKKGFYAKEGLATTGIAWIVMSLLGCLPFYISKEIPMFIDALFEMVSGFTTTGSSILSNVEAMSKGLLYWRSFSHWLGGMGVLVFLMAIVPLTHNNEGYTVHILKAESPGPSVGKLVPRMKQSALILYGIYVGLTVINIIFLLAGGMPLFDAICCAYGTAGTGGFGIKNDSMASYSEYIQNVTAIFMMLFGINFTCYYLILMKRCKEVIKDEELKLYFFFIIASTVLIAINMYRQFDGMEETISNVFFQVSSIITTTGYATCDFDLWPTFSKTILLFLMISGACAGSTGGGFKVSRILLLEKSLKRNFKKSLNVHEVNKVKVNGATVNEDVIDNVHGYLIAYVTIIIISILLLSMDNYPIETNISAVLATFNNIGPGVGLVGPTCNFGLYSPFSKLVMIVDMLAGRLEIFPIFMLFSKETWFKR